MKKSGYSWLDIQGASEHNLKSVDLRIPRENFVVFTGVSGSGKSSLAFDTIYVEGQRKYIESLSSYARQFLGQLERPRYERMTGLTPTVAIEQKTASANPRSTVGTVTEILDYVRVLFARAGDQRCPQCNDPVGRQDPQQMVDHLMRLPEDTQVLVLAPVVRQRKGEFRQQFEDFLKSGFVRFRIDREIVRLEEARPLEKNRKHDIDIVVDRLKIRESARGRLTESVETALKAGNGRLVAVVDDKDMPFSEELHCARCDLSLPRLTPQLFSFNNPLGACPECSGIGRAVDLDPERVFKQEVSLYRSLRRITTIWAGRRRGWKWEFYHLLEERLGISPRTSVSSLTEPEKRLIAYGTPDFDPDSDEGFPGLWHYVRTDLERTNSESVRQWYSRFFKQKECRTCGGARLRREARSVFVGDRSIVDLSRMTVSALVEFFTGLVLEDHRATIAAQPRHEVLARLSFLQDVGLEYLTLDRPAHTLSGGEAQRIRLARQLGSELSGVIYILDEPSVGLHQRDALRLVKTLERLRDIGNTIIVVEHDRETMKHADHVVDFGPGAGIHGGRVVYSGSLDGLLSCEESVTGGYLSGRLAIEIPEKRRQPDGWLQFKGVTIHNIANLDVEIPLRVFTVVTGVSGAGKSSLVTETVRPLLERELNGGSREANGLVRSVKGLDQVGKLIVIDQRPIGRTPRSNPVTYTKVFDVVRKLFAQTREARARGYTPGRFSFNVKGGRCERCSGDGALKIEMHFLPDVFIPCPQCKGMRFNDATLEVKYRDKSIADVLNMTVEEALEFFSAVPAAGRGLSTMVDVGLGYVKLGQRSTTLSGGEAQRIKLSRELARREKEHTFYILDEPTTGLHFHDINKLLEVIRRITDAGHTVLMVEHNMDIIKCADWVIDLGPDGGHKGGRIVAQGPPEKVARSRKSHTAVYLRETLR